MTARDIGRDGWRPSSGGWTSSSTARSLLGFPYAVVQKFGNDQAGSKAALIAYYGLFAIFPSLMLFTTILGYVLRDNDQLRKDLVESALGSFPIIGSQLQSQVHGLTGSVLVSSSGASSCCTGP